MKVAQNPHVILKIMQEHELLLSRLYALFAEKYPEHQTFWQGLSDDEIHHASLIDKMHETLNTNEAGFVVERFPLPAIETSLKFISKLIQEFSTTDLPLLKAVSHAYHLENALIENKYFEIFQGDHPDIQRALNRLLNETQKHFQMVRNFLAENN